MNSAVVLMAGAVAAMGVAASQPAVDQRAAHPHTKDDPAVFAPSYAVKESWERRVTFLKTQVQVAQGLWPTPPRTPLNAQVYGAIDRGDFTVEKVTFESIPGHVVTGNLYRPKSPGKHPAVLVPYGHWPGGRFMWVSDADIQKQIAAGAEVSADSARSPLQASCAMLARMGCVAFQWDLEGYCDSKQIEHQQGFLDTDAVLRLQSFMGLQTWNSVRALDFVAELPDVDGTRIACTGASSGGTQTIQLEALDDRLAASFPAVMVSMNMQGGCVCENAPLLRVGTDNVELASLFAPKPQGMAAANDWTHDFETRGLPEMKKIYGLYQAEQQVEGKYFSFPHNDNLSSREMMYTFLNHAFKLGHDAPVKESPIAPLPIEQLSVWDVDHKPPASGGGAADVRAWMTSTADAALAKFPADSRDYDAVLRGALGAMVVDSPPTVMEVAATPTTNTAQRWDGFIRRRDSQERVPCAALKPVHASGVAILWASGEGLKVLESAEAKSLVEGGAHVVAIAPFGSDAFPGPTDAATQPAKKSSNPPYSAYANGYERTILANRVHDLLTAAAFARTLPGVLEVRMLGQDKLGPAALLARALDSADISRAAIDLDSFDFDRVKDAHDEQMLPGALKYGGIYAFVPLCRGQTWITAARESGKFALAQNAPGVTLDSQSHPAADLIHWLTTPAP